MYISHRLAACRLPFIGRRKRRRYCSSETSAVCHYSGRRRLLPNWDNHTRIWCGDLNQRCPILSDPTKLHLCRTLKVLSLTHNQFKSWYIFTCRIHSFELIETQLYKIRNIGARDTIRICLRCENVQAARCHGVSILRIQTV